MTLQPTRPSDEPHLTMLHIRRWHDPLIDELGHDARSRYVERFWLGILGPSTCSISAVSPLFVSRVSAAGRFETGPVFSCLTTFAL